MRRFNHMDDIMPYSDDVPVAVNLCLVPLEEAAADPEYEKVQKRCELVGLALGTFSSIQLDARRRGRARFDVCYLYSWRF